MFRWLKDRKRSRKPSSGDGSVRSKEDDYGFKQKHPEWKRDLPPTPLDSASSLSSFTDDDKSFHIYEEIPDLPFRCTPEGELRISLVRETVAVRRDGGHARLDSDWSSSRLDACESNKLDTDGVRRDLDQSRTESDVSVPRTISPYMVVPLERLSGTPLEFQSHPQQDSNAFSCALVGRRRSPLSDGNSEDVSARDSTPSCDESSVFGTPLGEEGRGAGDISDRLLNAINLTRLLAAIRLSSSSADTCTTSPICIGVDRDGRNISLSLSVTPTTTISANNDDNNDVTEDVNGNHDHVIGTSGADDAQKQTETGSGEAQTDSSKPQTENNARRAPVHPGLRFLPSPSEQSALAEILQLRPGESTELDPATIDAIILRLCSESLSQDSESEQSRRIMGDAQGACSQRYRQDLTFALHDSAQCSSSGEQTEAQSNGDHQSPKSHRAENSDTCYEYDISTSSESDQTNYDYFLSKVTRTRSLESEVKKMIQETESLHGSQDSDQEGGFGNGGGSAGSFTSVSSVSHLYAGRHHNHRKKSPEVLISADSDDGTMADLSESENSSGYYESMPAHALAALYGLNRDGEKSVRFGSVGSSSAGKSSSFSSDRSDFGVRRVSMEADEILGGAKSGSGLSDPETRLASVSSFPAHSRKGSDPFTGLGAVSHDALPRPQHSRPCKGKCLVSGKSHHCHRHRGQKCGGKGKGKAEKEAEKSCGDVEIPETYTERDCVEDTNEASECRDRCFEADCSETCHKDAGEHACDQNCAKDCDYKDSCGACGSVKLDLPTGGRKVQFHRPAHSKGIDSQKPDCRQEKSEKPARRHQKERSNIKTNPKFSKDGSHQHSYLYTPHPSSSSTPKDIARSHKTSRGLKSRSTKDKPAPVHCERTSSDSAYEDRRHCGEVYSIPAAFSDPAACSSVRGLKGSASVPSKLSVARQIPESSEVYGTRAGLNGCHNRLLSDLIMMNYNRQVFNHV